MLPRNERRTRPYKTLQSRKDGKPRKPLRAAGISNRAKERAKWQREMVAKHAHIGYCEALEGCTSTFGLGHAHRVKKRFITTREEWMMVAKLCQFHHSALDEATGDDVHQQMYDYISEIIAKREHND